MLLINSDRVLSISGFPLAKQTNKETNLKSDLHTICKWGQKKWPTEAESEMFPAAAKATP